LVSKRSVVVLERLPSLVSRSNLRTVFAAAFDDRMRPLASSQFRVRKFWMCSHTRMPAMSAGNTSRPSRIFQ
jgi:hypothetical protein